MRIEAVYENGVLKLCNPSTCRSEHVALTIDRPEAAYEPDDAYVQSLRDTLKDAGPAPGLNEVRRGLSKIPGSMTADFIAEREDC